jgi:hypothetical protein
MRYFKLLYLFTVCFFTQWNLQAQQVITDPIQHYLTTNNETKAAGFFSFQQLDVLDLDLDGDGKSEKLISYNGTGGKMGLAWDVYKSLKEGYVQVDTGGESLTFHSLLFYVGRVTEISDYGLLIKVPRGGLEFYKLIGQRLVKKDPLSLEFTDAIWKKYFAGSSEENPHRAKLDHPMQEITKDDLRKMGYDLSAIDNARQPRDPFEVLANKPSGDVPSVGQSTTVVKSPTVQTPQPEPTAEPVQAPPAQPSPSAPVWPWAVGLLLLAVFGGVWWKFLRK